MRSELIQHDSQSHLTLINRPLRIIEVAETVEIPRYQVLEWGVEVETIV